MTSWPLHRRRGPGSALDRPATISITVDTTEPPRLLMWAYVQRVDGSRAWIGGTSETEVSFVGPCWIVAVAMSAEEPKYAPG